jgi:hypothetical protein
MRAAVIFALLLCSPIPCVAQDTLRQPEVDQRYLELVQWLDAYHKWEAWTQKWANRVAFNAAGGLIKNRPERPLPPEWLSEDCRSHLSTDGKLGEACRILEQWDLIVSGKTIAAAPKSDVPAKSSFLQRIHLSGGWVPAQLPAPKVYLVAGMQVGIIELGRVTLPSVGAGIIAMSDGTGGYEWKPATVIGVGYRLASFPFPWIKRESHLHINVARVTIHGASNIPLAGLDPSQNLVGFSLTFSKAH